jgi:dynein heavy chain
MAILPLFHYRMGHKPILFAIHAHAQKIMNDSSMLLKLFSKIVNIYFMYQIKALKEYFKDPKLTIDELMNISTAGAGLLRWVLAMMNYNNIAKVVQPKRLAVATAEKNLKNAMNELEKIQEEVNISGEKTLSHYNG